MGDLVQGFVRHPAGQGAVADDGHDVPVLAPPEPGLGNAEGIAERGRGVAVLDQVVLRLGPGGIAGKAAGLAQGGKGRGPAGHELVHVGLVAGVPDDGVAGALEDAVERQRQLDHAQVGREVAARLGDLGDLLRQLGQLRPVQKAQVGRSLDTVEHGHVVSNANGGRRPAVPPGARRAGFRPRSDLGGRW